LTPTVLVGRGAWSKTGKDNGSRFYQYLTGLPLDGAQPTRDVNYEAVSLGVKALQRRGNEYAALFGFGTVPVDGNFSPLDVRQYKLVQSRLGFTGKAVDGVIGPATARRLWHPLVEFYGKAQGVPPEHVWGMTALESAFDPGAVGWTTPSDRGLCQINLVAHTSVTVEQAFDPHYAINYTCDRLRKARAQFAGKGGELQRSCSIAQHNSPLAAQQWYSAGVPPTDQIAKYVSLVLTQAETF